MSNLSKFKSKVSADKKLQKRMKDASTIKDVVQIAASVGCNVTEDEVRDDMMEAISGGTAPELGEGLKSGLSRTSGGVGVNTTVTTGDNTVNFYQSVKKEASFSQNASGSNSFVSNSGGISIS